MTSTAKMLNRERLEKKLLALGNNAAEKTRKAVAKSAAELEDAARTLAPADSGDLRKSITHQISDNGLSAVVGTNRFYARFVEFGTKGGGKNRPDHAGTAAQPFLFPAYRILKKRLKGRINRSVKAAVKQAAKANLPDAPK
ncbi:MAG: HK97 gp10 family phage protein [Minwuia sp.]|nr:HK97 gp10 family phage protein [Minwuia sp.]